MGIVSLIASNNYIVVNKELANKFGLEAALMLGELASEFEYWNKENKLEDGYFFSTVENVKENTTLSDKKQRSALAILKNENIVDVKLKGLPAKRYIKINEEQVIKIMLNKNCQTGISSSAKMEELDVPKEQSNNNNFNNNKNSNNETDIKKESKGSFDKILSAYTSDEKTLDLLREWLKGRKSKRAAMTDRAIQMNIDKLDNIAFESNMSVDDYLAEVICRGWAAFYKINNYERSEKRSEQKPNSTDDFMNKLKSMYESEE